MYIFLLIISWNVLKIYCQQVCPVIILFSVLPKTGSGEEGGMILSSPVCQMVG